MKRQNSSRSSGKSFRGKWEAHLLEDTMSHRTLNHDFGAFTGFNYREDAPIERPLTGEDVVWWDHDRCGEAVFWPKGHMGLAILCSERKSITGMELRTLDRLLTDLGDDSKETYQRIHFARSQLGISLNKLTVQEVEGVNLQVFTGSTFFEQSKEAACKLFGKFFPGRVKFREKKGPVTQAVDWERVLNGPLRADLEAALREVEAIPDEED